MPTTQVMTVSRGHMPSERAQSHSERFFLIDVSLDDLMAESPVASTTGLSNHINLHGGLYD